MRGLILIGLMGPLIAGFSSAQIIIEDFRVNEHIGSCCHQYFPAVASDTDGNFIIAWTDSRQGEWDIYAQRYKIDGMPLGSNFKINDEANSGWQWSPALGMDGKGRFVVVWTDTRNGDPDIYAQHYGPNAQALGTNFRVNDDAEGNAQGSPAVAVDGSGGFIIVWEDRREGEWDIYAQRYNAEGQPLGKNFKVNDDASPGTRQKCPAIAVDDGGNFIIAWADDRNGDSDIYAQRYHYTGQPLGRNFRVNDDGRPDAQWPPAIAAGYNGDFIICWSDNRDGRPNIYAQRFDYNGHPIGENFKVTVDPRQTAQWSPDIAVDGEGNFVITWTDDRNDRCDIYARYYRSDGTPLGTEFRVNDDMERSDQRASKVAMDSQGRFIITWEDCRNVYSNIYAQIYTSEGKPWGVNFQVNDDLGGSIQRHPDIAADEKGDFIITWQDRRHGYLDIYAQRYDAYAQAKGGNFRVNDAIEGPPHGAPAVAVSKSGNFIIAWRDYRNGNWDIYAQRYDRNGEPLGVNFKVNDDVEDNRQEFPAIAIDDNGNFIIAWEDYRNGVSDIYAQRYYHNGEAAGPNFKVNDDPGDNPQRVPALACDDEGNFIIVWRDFRNDEGDIFAQWFDPMGRKIGTNFRVNDDSGKREQTSPDVATNGRGNFVIVWQDHRSGDSNIYAQLYNPNRSPLGTNFRVNDDPGNAWQWFPSVAMDSDGSFVIVWQDYRNGDPDIYAQRYDPEGTPYGVNYRVNGDGGPFEQQWPSVAFSRGRLYFTWGDNRLNGLGIDIFAKVADWNWMEAKDKLITEGTPPILLSQNYPNPFNSTTIIKYHLPERAHVTLRIFNLLGQLVKTLVNMEQSAGYKTVCWDGRDLENRGSPSGVYFYHLEARMRHKTYSTVKKMLLFR